jgi:putative glutamine amidotransferase
MNPNVNRIAPRVLGTTAPVVLVPACQRELGRHPFYVAGKKYLDAIRLAGCVPLVVPAAQAHELPTLMALADGLLLTGSPSNVHPSHFGEDVHNPELPLDPERDGWTLPAIRMALNQGMPLLGICRGFQEVNVALGGSLHQAVQEQPGLADHRGDHAAAVEVEYGFSHPVQAVPGGFLARTLQGLSVVEQGRFMVNSVHGQGIKQLAPGLKVEARAPDGLIEAFTFEAASGHPASFSLCMQWHPEWLAAGNPVSRRIFETFGDACRAYLASKARLQQAHRPEPFPLIEPQ